MAETIIDKKVQELEDWVMAAELATPQFTALTGIIDDIVKLTLQGFCNALIELTDVKFMNRRKEMITDRETKKGFWSKDLYEIQTFKKTVIG